MNLGHIAQGTNDILSLILVVRLSVLRLHSVYRVFCLFLLVQLAGSLFEYWAEFAGYHFDYRLFWIPMQFLLWSLSLWTIYVLLKDVLSNLPGILKLSRKVLNVVFAVTVAVALVSAQVEYGASNASSFVTPLGKIVGRMIVLDRAISSAALLAILAILLFLLWFPVQMPRNLAVFNAGFAAYFAARTASLLAWSLWSNASFRLLDNITILILTVCYAYWAIFITAEGEAAPVRPGHSWDRGQQERLIAQMEAMNASLLRTARR